MATQCRSSKCTAERKGFRRELDSWRHKLIHCVGFESILEGIYGPRLLQDLNIFDECEPEAVDDWSVDANCAFCNLQLEKLNDHSSAVAVPGSPTHAETPSPQSLSTSEKLQCQADRFLHAIFRKKEFPQSCDSSIPLVAQELMRKMIRRFALEYASKSQAHEGLNSLSDNSERLPKQPDSDGPLDLTVSRASQALQQADGVLDLSKKNSSENASIQQKVSCSSGPNEEDQPRLGKKDDSKDPEAWKVTVLEKVLSSFCSRHRLLLHHILMDMQEDYNNSVTLRDVHRRQFKAESLCCNADKKLLNESPILALNDCSVTAGTCYRTACRFSTCTIPPICVCLKNIHSQSCQNIAVACVGQVMCYNPTVCCTHSKIPLCQYQQNSDHAYVCCTRSAPVTSQNNCNSQNGSRGSRSPSPPPLSPKPVDTEGKMTVKTSIFHLQDCKTLNMAPPSLLPHRTEDEDPSWHSNTPIRAGSPDCDKVVTSHTQADKENDQCGSLIGDLMERVTEKLRSIQPSEREQSLASQISKTRDDTHLTEIITTVLHNSSDKDYNLNDLLQKHGQRSPQTRSRRRLDTLEAMSKSPDHLSSRRQSLQIKRDLARLSPSNFRTKIGSERKKIKAITPSTHSGVEQNVSRLVERGSKTVNTELPDSSGNLTTQNDEIQNDQETQPHDEPSSLDERTEVQATDLHQKVKTKTCQETSLTVQIGRSRRNIVPPQRFSSYVTEPRKMYFAACFSESIFIKHFPEDSSSTALCSTEETVHPSDKPPLITDDEKQGCDVPQNMALAKYDILCKEETICEHENCGRNPHKTSPKKRKMHPNSTSPLKRSKPCRSNSLDTVSSTPTETVPNSTTTESVRHAKESQRGLKYNSPIKLMFVSSETGEDGIKYTLKAATSGSNSQEVFDPCVESSWEGSVIDKQVQDSGEVIEPALEGSPIEVVELPPSCSNSESENLESIQIAHQTSPVKRRPGRPKKLGPHIVKSVKRPIGRPPKPKMTDLDVSTGKTGPSVVDRRATEISQKDDGNKNLKITIVYGRSRRARRVVSEDFGHLSVYQNDCGLSKGGKCSKASSGKKTSNDQITKEQLKDLHFVMPVEDKKCTVSSSCNIKCQRQSDVAVFRKPGRPPKVKISGISVTVNSESPRQRKIHMKRDTKDSHLLRRNLLVEFLPSKDKTLDTPTDSPKDALTAPGKCPQNPRRPLKPVRHSVRERKPSIYLLHSVATARSCALVCRSRKLLLNKASSEASHPTESKHEDPSNDALSKKTKNVSCMQDIVRFSAVSVDPIFSSNDQVRWWPTSASPETLNEELARRIRLMSSTWVSDVLEANKAEIQTSAKPKTYERLNGTAKKSAVKKLFDQNYDIESLCTWFMQTTETQSLAIVKKASVHNPKEFFQYNPSRPNYKVNVCPSPQAERLKKHVKKFAKIVPKSPSMHKEEQEMFRRARRSQAKRKLFKTHPIKLRNDIGQQLSRSRTTWLVYSTTLLRARLKFQTRTRKTRLDKAHKIFIGQMGTRTTGAHTIKLLKEIHSFVNKTPAPIMKLRNALKHSLKCTGVVRTSRKTLGNSKENRIGSKALSPESLKECRVFVKKMNSPNTKSTTEECNNCKTHSDGSSEQENERNGDIVVQGVLKSPVPSSPKCEGKRKGIKRKSYSTSPSLPAKMLRQSRSSRGVLGARWCDFVLGKS
ncbi:putative ligand-dependent nuclear receptor corepressor-like protein [Triplophysa rosa]|uniref:Ligand-dependent nuclear receptor corepressor-like protein n=1 Tax=Triplophysa rosa TaxID=992332 RepID=A0A9W7X0B1_TRIRA|nr:putative ligand-dependent nuclear receptor corepressor-like protein [Triplophysa rosa]